MVHRVMFATVAAILTASATALQVDTGKVVECDEITNWSVCDANPDCVWFKRIC